MFERLAQDQPSSNDKNATTLGKGLPDVTVCQPQDIGDTSKTDAIPDYEKLNRIDYEAGGKRDDVVHCSSMVFVLEDELPPPLFTKTILAKFRSMEEANAKNRQPLRTKSAPSTPIKRPVQHDDPRRKLSVRSSPSESVASMSSSDFDLAETDMSCRDIMTHQLETVDELPHHGLAKSLLAQWRMLEDQSRKAKDRDGSGKLYSKVRSHSLTRIEAKQGLTVCGDKQLSRVSVPGGKSSETIPSSSSKESARNEYELKDEDYLPPPLMTKYVLAKFRDLEAESQIFARFQQSSKKVGNFQTNSVSLYFFILILRDEAQSF